MNICTNSAVNFAQRYFHVFLKIITNFLIDSSDKKILIHIIINIFLRNINSVSERFVNLFFY